MARKCRANGMWLFLLNSRHEAEALCHPSGAAPLGTPPKTWAIAARSLLLESTQPLGIQSILHLTKSDKSSIGLSIGAVGSDTYLREVSI
jgi:hypothetical protein